MLHGAPVDKVSTCDRTLCSGVPCLFAAKVKPSGLLVALSEATQHHEPSCLFVPCGDRRFLCLCALANCLLRRWQKRLEQLDLTNRLYRCHIDGSCRLCTEQLRPLVT